MERFCWLGEQRVGLLDYVDYEGERGDEVQAQAQGQIQGQVQGQVQVHAKHGTAARQI